MTTPIRADKKEDITFRAVLEKLEFESIEISCSKCNGQGFTAEHATGAYSHDEDGSCNSECPVQVQCQECYATGKISVLKVKDIDSVLKELSEIVLGERKYLKGSDSPQDKYLEQMKGWNACCEHISNLILGG